MPFEFDPLSSNFAQDPYKVYAQLRSQETPFYHAELDMHLLSRYADVSEVALSKNSVRSLVGYETPAALAVRQRDANWHDMPYHERFVQFSLLDSDGHIHQRLRRQILPAFTGRAIVSMETDIQSIVDTILSRIQDSDRIDFIEDFAVHIPGLVISKLLGVPAQDAPQLRAWSEQIVSFFDIDRSDAKKHLAETATHEFHDYLVDLIEQRKKRAKDDLISKMIADEAAGAYEADELISSCMLILMAGHGSTIDVLGSGLHTLLLHPDAMQSLRESNGLLPNAIQEIFRYQPPLPFFHRHAIADIMVNGVSYPAGTSFGLLYASANRDAAAFDRPDEFLMDRQANRHLSFGRGVHLCLGNHLARLNMKVIFSSLLERFKEIALVDESVVYKRGLSVRGPEALHIRLTKK